MLLWRSHAITILSFFNPCLELALCSNLRLKLALPVLKLLSAHLLGNAQLLRLLVFLLSSLSSFLFDLLLPSSCIIIFATHAVFVRVCVTSLVVLQGHKCKRVTVSILDSSLLFISQHSHPFSLLLTLVLVLHKPVEFLFVVILDALHASRCCTIQDACLLLLPVLVLDWTIASWMRLTMAEVTENSCAINQQLLWTVLKLVTLLTA